MKTNNLSFDCNNSEEQGKEDEKRRVKANEEFSLKKLRVDIPSNDNAPNQNSQRSNTIQPEQSPVTSSPGVVPSGTPMQCGPQVQLNPGFLHGPPGFIPSTSPAIGTGSVGPIPGVCYQFGYPYPGFSGPLDPSSWRTQVQAVQRSPPYVLPVSGACNYFPVPVQKSPSLSSGASVHSSQNGVIRPSVKISQRHQILWAAQSAENVLLRSSVASLQSELAHVKRRLVKLENNMKSLKPSREQLESHHKTCELARKTTRGRGRPTKSGLSSGALTSDDGFHPHPQGRPPLHENTPPEIKKTNLRGTRPLHKNGTPEIKEISLRKDWQIKEENLEKPSPVERFINSPSPACQNLIFHKIMHTQCNEMRAVDHESRERVNGSYISAAANPSSLFPSNNQYCDNNGGVRSWSLANEENDSEDFDEETIKLCRQQYEEIPYDANTLQDSDNLSEFPQ